MSHAFMFFRLSAVSCFLVMSALATSMLETACSPDCDATFADGSDACSPPVLASDLEGEWCDTTTCLEASGDLAHYRWIDARTHRVMSEGLLTGGLEFTPQSAPGVFRSAEFYSTSVDWTETGIALFFDNGQHLTLAYRSEP